MRTGDSVNPISARLDVVEAKALPMHSEIASVWVVVSVDLFPRGGAALPKPVGNGLGRLSEDEPKADGNNQ